VSRAAEESEARWFAQHKLDCAKHFVVGAQVYRAGWDCIEKGVVRRVVRCRIPKYSGDPIECEDGDHMLYIAQFGEGHGLGSWVDQTFAYRFFWSEADARRDLLRNLRGRISEKQREIQELNKLVASFSVVLNAPHVTPEDV
jgi:hypothetical protein